MATATVYSPTDKQNMKSVLRAMQKYDRESNNRPTFPEIVNEMCKIQPDLDKQRAIRVLSEVIPRLKTEGYVNEEYRENAHGNDVTVYRLLPKTRSMFFD